MSKPVRSWKDIALLHALYSEWIISAETVNQLSPEAGQAFETGTTLYQREMGRIAESLRRIIASVGVGL